MTRLEKKSKNIVGAAADSTQLQDVLGFMELKKGRGARKAEGG